MPIDPVLDALDAKLVNARDLNGRNPRPACARARPRPGRRPPAALGPNATRGREADLRSGRGSTTLIVYFDTSALVKLIFNEPGSEDAAELWDRADPRGVRAARVPEPLPADIRVVDRWLISVPCG